MKITKQIMEEFLNFYRNQNFQNDTIENYRRDFTEFMRLFIRR
nr:MAG TPA: integrase [Bacteriophage sp.]DAX26895.1 MAG TPA: integrase [Caudoviricetes sp.]